MVWSDGSKYLAVPEWHVELSLKKVGRFQRLLVVVVKDKTSSYASGTYPVLELTLSRME